MTTVEYSPSVKSFIARVLGWSFVTDFGAVADNVTDNLAAFQAARDATIPGGTIYVPAAVSWYYLSGQLDLSGKNVGIVGPGWNCSTQPSYGSGGFTTAAITGAVLRFGNTTAAGLYFGGSHVAGSVAGIACIGPGSGTSRGVQFGDVSSAAVRVALDTVFVGNWSQGFYSANMDNSNIRRLTAIGNDSGVTLTNASNANTFTEIDVEVSTTYGVRLDASVLNLFDGGVLQGGLGTTVSIVNAAQGNKFDTVYWENAGATWGVDVASGCDFNKWDNCHFGHGATTDQVRIASNHCAVILPQAAPLVTVSGSYNFFVGLFANGESDTGSHNIWIDTNTGGKGVRFGALDVRIESGQHFYFETTGTGSYIMRETATGDTIVSSGSIVVKTPTNMVLRSGLAATGSRPAAATAGAGSRFYDTTLSKPIWSDGTVWRDATGTAV